MSLKVSTVGIIGGGQLGMFLAHSCNKLGLRVFVYSDSKEFLQKNMLTRCSTAPLKILKV
jgi:phosphoribosylaminoimidazole carboxylase (NCAIR synthetase)